jgi:hypothetical protein
MILAAHRYMPSRLVPTGIDAVRDGFSYDPTPVLLGICRSTVPARPATT